MFAAGLSLKSDQDTNKTNAVKSEVMDCSMEDVLSPSSIAHNNVQCRSSATLGTFSLAAAQHASASSKDAVYTPSDDFAQLSFDDASPSLFKQSPQHDSPSSIVFEADLEDADTLESSVNDTTSMEEGKDNDCSISKVIKHQTQGAETNILMTERKRPPMPFPAPPTGPLRQSSIYTFFSPNSTPSKAGTMKTESGVASKLTHSTSASPGRKSDSWPKKMLRTTSEPPASHQQRGRGRGRAAHRSVWSREGDPDGGHPENGAEE